MSLGAEDVDVHGREDVGVDDPLSAAVLFPTGVDGVRVPVGPEERVLVEGESEGVRELTLHHHLPVNTHTHTRR